MNLIVVLLLILPAMAQAGCGDDLLEKQARALSAAIQHVRAAAAPREVSAISPSLKGEPTPQHGGLESYTVEVSWMQSDIAATRYEQRILVILDPAGADATKELESPVRSPLLVPKNHMRIIAEKASGRWDQRSVEVFAGGGLDAQVVVESGGKAILVGIENVTAEHCWPAPSWNGDFEKLNQVLAPHVSGAEIKSVLLVKKSSANAVAIVRFRNAPSKMFEVEIDGDSIRTAKFVETEL